MKKMCLFFLVSISIIVTTFPQSYLDSYEGIPMVTFGWTSNDYWLPTYNYSKIKEMGTNIYIAPDMIATKFDIYRNANLKLIPYQVSTEFQRVNHIARYTEGIYSVWEAEGFDNSGAEIQLSYLPQNATVFNEGIISGINTTGNPGYLNSGPGYIQPVTYAIDASSNITYTAKFKLKVGPKNGNQVPLTNNTDNICRIEVLSNGNILASHTIKAYQFVTYGAWNNIDDEAFTLSYSKANNASSNTSHPVQTNLLYTGTQRTEREIFSNIEYKVYFYGTETDYLTLFVDNILVYDTRGNELLTSPPKQQDIINQANNFDNINKFTTDQTAFDSTVVGWYPIDEPSFIDNFACVKKVAELLKNNATNKKLVTSIAGVWNGRVYDGSVVYRIDELIKRTGIEEVIMNNFIFDYPYNDNVPDYANLNIENMVVNHLDKLNNYNVPFVLALQVGKWNALDGLLEKIPTQEQLLYNMNVGLLYGAKGISISNYFYDLDGISNTTALCGFSGPDNNENFSYTPLWDYIKNGISPRLKGFFGKTIKGLQQLIQLPNIDANGSPSINYEFVNTVGAVNNTQQLPCVLDLGFFSGGGKKYFMAVNRYYSEFENVRFYFQELNNYKNWEITNIVNPLLKTTIVTRVNNTADFTAVIPKGDAGLYSVLPVVKNGGVLIGNETISGSLQMEGSVNIASGVTLTLANNSVITFINQGFIANDGTLNIGTNVTLNISDWSKSLLLSNTTGTNPKLLWGAYTAFAPTKYRVYRLTSSTPVSDPSALWSQFQLIYTSPNASTYNFNDADVMIGGGAYIYYCVTAFRVTNPKTGAGIESGKSNFTATHGGFYKKADNEETRSEQNFSFSLDQNYPNPFNPMTSIKYQLQKNGTVTLKVFDMLGKEVKTLVNEFKEKGEYTVQFDASLLPSGMYVYQIKANEYIATKKMLLLK